MPDNPRDYDKRLISLFDQAALKGMSAWAFGLERIGRTVGTRADLA